MKQEKLFIEFSWPEKYKLEKQHFQLLQEMCNVKFKNVKCNVKCEMLPDFRFSTENSSNKK